MEDLISRSEVVKALHEYAEQKFAGGEVELANGILKAKCFLENGNVPTAYDVEAVVSELEEILDEFYLMKPHDQEKPYNEGVQKGYKCALEIVRNGGKGALRGCRNCKHQTEQLADCEWLKSQGQFIRECYKWEGKE